MATFKTKLNDEERESKARIRNEVRLLLEKVRQNPSKWNSKYLSFKVNFSEALFAPFVFVENLKSGSLMVKGPICPQHFWETVGEVNCYEKFELKFEFKMNKCVDHQLCVEIGKWFGLELHKKENQRADVLLKQSNGLYNDRNPHHTKREISLPLGQWVKELSTKQDIKSWPWVKHQYTTLNVQLSGAFIWSYT